MSSTSERRSRRRDTHHAGILHLELKDKMGHSRWVTADLLNASESGIGVSLMFRLQAATQLMVRGKLGRNPVETKVLMEVVWCLENDGRFHAGLEFVDQAPRGAKATEASGADEPDYYEVLQLSPNATAETVERVYRLLARRYHPDNPETGNSEMFLKLSEAYQVLCDASRRARYDVRHAETKRLQWKIFDQHVPASGRDDEVKKRKGILELLYTKTLKDPERATMTIFEFEELLGCPREHLQAALWYLRGKRFIQRADNGRYTITVLGFDEVEAPQSGVARPTGDQMLLESADQDRD